MPKIELPVPPPPEKFAEHPYVETDLRKGAFPVELRFQVRYDQKFSCAACGEYCRGEQFHEPMLDVHHIVPIARGGTDARENALGLCNECHDIFDYLAIKHNTSAIPILKAMGRPTVTPDPPTRVILDRRNLPQIQPRAEIFNLSTLSAD